MTVSKEDYAAYMQAKESYDDCSTILGLEITRIVTVLNDHRKKWGYGKLAELDLSDVNSAMDRWEIEDNKIKIYWSYYDERGSYRFPLVWLTEEGALEEALRWLPDSHRERLLSVRKYEIAEAERQVKYAQDRLCKLKELQ